jgi:pyruvate carboxylase
VIVTATVRGQSHQVELRAVNGRYIAIIGDRSLEVDYLDSPDGFASLLVGGRSHEALVTRRPWGYAVALRSGGSAGVVVRLVAPMPGKVVRVLVERGQAVAEAQGLVVVEAMKMENEIRAPREGTISEVHVREGQAVEGGALLVVLE